MTVDDLDRIFKAYDVRGVVPDDLNEDVARRIGAAFAEWSGRAEGRDRPATAGSRRPTSPPRSPTGITSRGAGVVDLGLASTDLLYFASGSLDLPGRDAHGQPQSEAVQRIEVLPVGCPPRRGGERSPSRSAR